jgi:hypothetical protein
MVQPGALAAVIAIDVLTVDRWCTRTDWAACLTVVAGASMVARTAPLAALGAVVAKDVDKLYIYLRIELINCYMSLFYMSFATLA